MKTEGFVSTEWKTPDTYDRNFAELPSSQGIYLLVECNVDPENFYHRVLYVGSSSNLKNRLSRRHEKLELARNLFPYVQRYFAEVTGDVLKTEIQFIKRFNPPLNIVHKNA